MMSAVAPTPLSDAMWLVQRNLPSYPASFSPCKCGRAAGRGSGPCIICAEEHLSAIVGTALAGGYVRNIKEQRRIEDSMAHACKS